MVAELCHGGSLRDVVRDQMVSFSRVGVFCRHRSAQPFCGVTQRYSYSAQGSRRGIIVASAQLEVSVCPCWGVVAGMIPMMRVHVTCAGGLHVCGRAAVEHQHRRGAGVPAQAAAHDHSPRCEAGQRAAAGWAAAPQGLACSCSVGLTDVTAEPRLQAMASLQVGGSPGSGRCLGFGCCKHQHRSATAGPAHPDSPQVLCGAHGNSRALLPMFSFTTSTGTEKRWDAKLTDFGLHATVEALDTSSATQSV